MIQIHTYTPDDPGLLHTDLTKLDTKPQDLPPGLTATLARMCRTQKAVGLAANQLGMSANMFYIATQNKPPFQGQILINPTWSPAPGASYARCIEGCMSLPGLRFAVSRCEVIDAQWTTISGKRRSVRLRGFVAQIFQHEHDHLRGLTLLETGKAV